MTSDAGNFFLCLLAICIYSCAKCLSKLLLNCLSFSDQVRILYWYVRWMQALCQICVLSKFFPACLWLACLFSYRYILMFLFLLKLSLLWGVIFSFGHSWFLNPFKETLPALKVIKRFSYLFLLVALCFCSYIYNRIHSQYTRNVPRAQQGVSY